MIKICDMHCHILPNLDDGPDSMEETIETLYRASKENIAEIIVTPHYYPGRYTPSPEEIIHQIYLAQRECNRRDIPIVLYPGAECYYFGGLTRLLDEGKVLTLADSNYVLVEFEPDCLFSYLRNAMQDIISSGYQPILAHFERMQCLKNNDRLLQLKREGILLQMNYETLLQGKSFLFKSRWKTLVQQGIVDYLGSDCHGMKFRPIHVNEALNWMDHHVDPEIHTQILQTNIQSIIEAPWRSTRERHYQ